MSAQAVTTYRYLDLQPGHIRILVLQSGSSGSPLRAKLEHARLDTARYKAISYVWGPEVFPHDVEILSSGNVRLTESLHAALHEFREDTGEIRLWADAVCINQADVQERSVQVALMGRLYMNAEQVLVWLGPSQANDALAFAALNAFTKHQNEYETLKWKGVYDGQTTEDFMLSAVNSDLLNWEARPYCDPAAPKPENPAMAAFMAALNLFHRPWFSRVWVMQEVLLNQYTTLLCIGSYRSRFTAFGCVLNILADLRKHGTVLLQPYAAYCPHYNRTLDRYINSGLTDYVAGAPGSCLPYLLRKFRERYCKDPRDRVFSLYWILNLMEPPNLAPDYKLSTLEVYTRAALASWSYEVLAVAPTTSPLKSTNQTEWPSWLPNFHGLTSSSRAKDGRYFDTLDIGSDAELLATLRPLRSHSLSDPNVLHIKGRIIGKVYIVLPFSNCPPHPEALNESTAENIFPPFCDWYLRCEHFLLERHPQLTAREIVELVTNGSNLSQHRNGRAFSEWQTLNKIFKSCMREKWVGSEEDLHVVSQQLAPVIADPRQYQDEDLLVCAVIIQDKETVGRVPSVARPGDDLCIFAGCRYPFLLRRRTDDCYTSLGDAFILDVGNYYRASYDGYHRAREQTQELLANVDWIALR